MKYVILAVCLVCLIPAGCRPTQPDNTGLPAENRPAALFTIQNYASDLSSHVYRYDQHPQRIVALWQNSVETLIALGAAEQIVAACGITDERYLKPEHLPSYRKIPVKSNQILSKEDMLLLEPNFILGWLFDFSGKANSLGSSFFWEKRQVNVYINLMNGADFQAWHTLEDELNYIRDVGKIVNREEEAARAIKNIADKIALHKQNQANAKPQRVLLVSNIGKNLTVYTPQTLPGDIVAQLGATVLGQERESVGEDAFFSYEDVVMLEPDIVFLQSAPGRDHVVLSAFYQNPVLRNLRCAQKKRVFCIPFYTIRSPGIRVADAIDIFAVGLQKSYGDDDE